MKKQLTFVLLLVASFAQAKHENQEDRLKKECAQGNCDSCLTLIHRNSHLDEIAQKLDDKQWLEQEKLGIALLPLYTECTVHGKHCKKFVKQVLRLQEYKKNNS